MKPRLPSSVALLLLSSLASSGSAYAGEEEIAQKDDRSAELPRPRDGNVAIRQELDAARRARTIEAYDLFIARHPNHPLAEEARREREALVRRQPK